MPITNCLQVVLLLGTVLDFGRVADLVKQSVYICDFVCNVQPKVPFDGDTVVSVKIQWTDHSRGKHIHPASQLHLRIGRNHPLQPHDTFSSLCSSSQNGWHRCLKRVAHKYQLKPADHMHHALSSHQAFPASSTYLVGISIHLRRLTLWFTSLTVVANSGLWFIRSLDCN